MQSGGGGDSSNTIHSANPRVAAPPFVHADTRTPKAKSQPYIRRIPQAAFLIAFPWNVFFTFLAVGSLVLARSSTCSRLLTLFRMREWM